MDTKFGKGFDLELTRVLSEAVVAGANVPSIRNAGKKIKRLIFDELYGSPRYERLEGEPQSEREIPF
jgi:hypothetical protein